MRLSLSLVVVAMTPAAGYAQGDADGALVPPADESATAPPASPAVCAPTDAVDPLRLLRQTSLDVRGRVPDVDEYAVVREAPDPSAAVARMTDAWLASGEFLDEVRRRHRELLWNRLDPGVTLTALRQRIFPERDLGVWFLVDNADLYRGKDRLPCLDREQTDFDAAGRPIPYEVTQDPTCQGGVCQREGWRWIRPWWDPEAPVRVCAYDAQVAAIGLDGRPCDVYNPDPACGCGPGLRWCATPRATEAPIRRALEEEPLRIVAHVVGEGLPYPEVLRTRTSFVNGPLAFYYRNQTGSSEPEIGGETVYAALMGNVPQFPFEDEDRWYAVQREAGHAGVLTTPAYLLRFATGRARANRFYEAFLCDPFEPTADGLPAEEADPDPNLRERPGCADCHRELEPAAAHWARWRTGGTHGYLDAGALDFVSPRADCARCAEPGRGCSPYCRAYFVTPHGAHPLEVERWAGLPLAGLWLEPADRDRVDAGPLALTDEPAEVSRVARCAVRTLATDLLGRELQADEAGWLEAHTDAFLADGLDWARMLRRLLEDPIYRAIR